MSSSRETPIKIENRLLAALPRAEYERLLPHLQSVRLTRNKFLCEAGADAQHAFFLNEGMAWLLAITENGEALDVGLVGNEGFVGVPIILNQSTVPYRVIIHLPGEALRIATEPLLAEFNRGGRLQRELLNYAGVLQQQLVQSAICHSLHEIRRRVCRWLLVTSDCLGSHTLDTTHERIANLLGHQRNRISLAVAELQKRSLIENQPGCITVLDRKGLEAAACECYRIIRDSVALSLTNAHIKDVWVP